MGLPDHLATRIERLLATGERVILGIAGAPGAGKSTLAEAVVAHFGERAVWVPMDGFHLADVELTRLGRLDHKGAIDTFDGYGYLAMLQRLRARLAHIVYAPGFERDLEQAIAGSIPVFPETQLVVTEGNYLLDDDPPWPAVRDVMSEVWFIVADHHLRVRRLVARHAQFGKTPERAEVWVRDKDELNTLRIERCRHKADLVVTP